MTEAEVKQIFKKTGVLQEGHFELSSGLHSNKYLQCAQVLQHPTYAQKLAEALADKFSEFEIDVVVGPAMGGITLAYAVGLALETKAIFTERKEGEMVLRRGFALAPDDKVLVVDDVLTTGKSVREVIELVEKEQAQLEGVGVLVDRSGGEVEFDASLKAMLEVEVEAYQPENCPLCSKDQPFDKPGSRNLKSN